MPRNQRLFDGVRVILLTSHLDDRGFFREVAKKSWKVSDIRQVSVSQTKVGIIKAFHWHEHQRDVWHLLSGRILVGLHDLRKNSKTFGQTISFEWDSKKAACLLVIPKKIAHGYKVLDSPSAVMLYLMDKEYNPKKSDEKRIPFDDPLVSMDWNEAGTQAILDFID